MTSPADRRAARMARLKQMQAQISVGAAQRERQAALTQRSEAAALRASADATLMRALLPPERGLTRTALFDRLRSVAVVRAHALEVVHSAGELEAAAAGREETAAGLQQAAAAHHRKQKKIEHWHSRLRDAGMRRRERVRHSQELEELSCQRRFTR